MNSGSARPTNAPTVNVGAVNLEARQQDGGVERRPPPSTREAPISDTATTTAAATNASGTRPPRREPGEHQPGEHDRNDAPRVRDDAGDRRQAQRQQHAGQHRLRDRRRDAGDQATECRPERREQDQCGGHEERPRPPPASRPRRCPVATSRAAPGVDHATVIGIRYRHASTTHARAHRHARRGEQSARRLRRVRSDGIEPGQHDREGARESDQGRHHHPRQDRAGQGCGFGHGSEVIAEAYRLAYARPMRCASTTACTRSRAPSFCRMRETCVLTVASPMYSARAISALLRASASRGQHLGLTVGERLGEGDPGRRGARRRAWSRWPVRGSRRTAREPDASPRGRASRRRPPERGRRAIRSSAPAFLSRNPLAPASSAWY